MNAWEIWSVIIKAKKDWWDIGRTQHKSLIGTVYGWHGIKTLIYGCIWTFKRIKGCHYESSNRKSCAHSSNLHPFISPVRYWVRPGCHAVHAFSSTGRLFVVYMIPFNVRGYQLDGIAPINVVTVRLCQWCTPHVGSIWGHHWLLLPEFLTGWQPQ